MIKDYGDIVEVRERQSEKFQGVGLEVVKTEFKKKLIYVHMPRLIAKIGNNFQINRQLPFQAFQSGPRTQLNITLIRGTQTSFGKLRKLRKLNPL